MRRRISLHDGETRSLLERDEHIRRSFLQGLASDAFFQCLQTEASVLANAKVGRLQDGVFDADETKESDECCLPLDYRACTSRVQMCIVRSILPHSRTATCAEPTTEKPTVTRQRMRTKLAGSGSGSWTQTSKSEKLQLVCDDLLSWSFQSWVRGAQFPCEISSPAHFVF